MAEFGFVIMPRKKKHQSRTAARITGGPTSGEAKSFYKVLTESTGQKNKEGKEVQNILHPLRGSLSDADLLSGKRTQRKSSS